MSQNPAISIASTIQSASLNRAPSPTHDINPSTAASRKEPVRIGSTSSASSIPSDVIKPLPRRTTLPPLPDLRFEQSYLASIQHAESWGQVGWITMRDQLFLPLIQGVVWTLALSGWRYWNRTANYSGHSVGSKVRRWWYDVNHWKIPNKSPEQVAREMRFAGDVRDYYVAQFANPAGD